MIRERAYSSSGGSRFLKFIAAALSGAFPTFAIAQQLQNATAADGSILPFRQCRRLNGSAEGIRQTEANIIEQDNDDIGRVFRQMTRLSAAYICAANSILEIDQDQRGFLARRASSARRNTDMAFGTIMVNVDFDEDSQDRIHIAVGIANRFGSFLIGVAGWSLRKHDDARLAGMDYTTENPQKKILERLEQLKATFQRIVGANTRGTEWRSSTTFPNEFISAQARAADLLVIGQALFRAMNFTLTIPER